MTEQELFNEYRKSNCKSFSDFLLNKIADLEKENAELDCQKNRNKFCYSCANATERCFRNEIGCPCGKYKSYKDENAKLKEVIDNDVDKKIYVQLANKANLADVQKDQLTNALGLLAKWVELFKPKLEGYPITPIQEQTEQFLKDSQQEE